MDSCTPQAPAPHFPDKVLDNIFSNLDTHSLVVAQTVCKLWQTVADSPRLWCNIHVPSKLAAAAQTSHVEWLLEKSRGQAKELILDGCQAVEGDFLETLASTCPLLELISVRRCRRLTAAMLQAYISRLVFQPGPQHLKSLNVEGCGLPPNGIRDLEVLCKAICAQLDIFACRRCNGAGHFATGAMAEKLCAVCILSLYMQIAEEHLGPASLRMFQLALPRGAVVNPVAAPVLAEPPPVIPVIPAAP